LDFSHSTFAAKKFDRPDADIFSPPNLAYEGKNSIVRPHSALKRGRDSRQAWIPWNLMMPRPNGDRLSGRFNHQAGREDRILGKMKRKNPMPKQIQLTIYSVSGHIHHAINLQHLLNRQVNLGELGAAINRMEHGKGRRVTVGQGRGESMFYLKNGPRRQSDAIN
jgi:hypothetical protein